MTSGTLTTTASPAHHDLLERLAAGDSAVWEYVVRAYRPCLLARASELRLRSWQRQDMEQRVWLALLQYAASIRDADCLPGWLSTTARRTALAILREEARELAVDEPPEHDLPAESDVERYSLDRHEVRELRSAIGQLPPHQQALMAGLLDDLTYDELASLLGVPIGSIGPTRQRALKRLRVVLQAA